MEQSQLLCAMCCCTIALTSTELSPSACRMKHGSRSHRICETCWWGTFAVESACHHCPGCVKGLPLATVHPKKNATTTTIIIDLTDDDAF